MPRIILVILITTFGIGCQRAETLECIAPANPGGGWDLTCRSLGNVLQELDLIEGQMRTTNMPGAGGGVAFAHVVTEQSTNDRLLVAASPGTTLRLAQGQYGDFQPEDVRWLGAISADFGMIAVAASSPFRSLHDVVEAWRTNPGSATLGGGSAVGGQDHMMSLLLAKSAGLDPLQLRYVSFDGGGEALAAALGGHVDMVSGDVTSNVAQIEAGTMRALAVLAPNRLEGPLSDVPTAKEFGYDVEWPIFRGYFGPAGMPDEAADRWIEILEITAASDAWAAARMQHNLQPFAMTGASFEAYIYKQIEDLRALSREIGLTE